MDYFFPYPDIESGTQLDDDDWLSSPNDEHPPADVPIANPYTNNYNLRSRGKIYNISIKRALREMPQAADESIKAELTQLLSKGVFEPVKLSKESSKAIPSHLFLKEKFDAEGNFIKLKSRLVANGSFQDRDKILYEDASSPTAATPHVFMVAALAARDGKIVKTVDVSGAFLHASLKEKQVYMTLDPHIASIITQIDPSFGRYKLKNGSIAVKLLKALYGCVESSKLWYDLLTSKLAADGYSANPADECVWNKGAGDKQVTVVVYVDDLFICSKDAAGIDSLISMLRKEFEDITVNDGPTQSYLGMLFDFSKPSVASISMTAYTDEILAEAAGLKVYTTPATENLFQTRDTATLLDEKGKKHFHSIVAKLLYLAKRTRPDVLLPVSFLTTRVQRPDEDDDKKLQRVLGYLKGCPHLGISLHADKPVQVKAFIDASYGVHEDARSHSGLILTLGNGPVLAKSRKQTSVSKSSTEAELIAFSDLSTEAIFGAEFIAGQGEKMKQTLILQDNMSTIALIENGKSKSDRTRHIKIRYFWSKQLIDDGTVVIEYLPTNDMLADCLTKPLQGAKFTEMREKLLNWIV